MGILIGILMMDSMGWPYDSSDCLLLINDRAVEQALQPPPARCTFILLLLLDYSRLHFYTPYIKVKINISYPFLVFW